MGFDLERRGLVEEVVELHDVRLGAETTVDPRDLEGLFGPHGPTSQVDEAGVCPADHDPFPHLLSGVTRDEVCFHAPLTDVRVAHGTLVPEPLFLLRQMPGTERPLSFSPVVGVPGLLWPLAHVSRGTGVGARSGMTLVGEMTRHGVALSCLWWVSASSSLTSAVTDEGKDTGKKKSRPEKRVGSE